MKRLTYRLESNAANLYDVDKAHGDKTKESVARQNAFDLLAAYEDTGLTPEEISCWVPVSERLPESAGSYLVYYHEWSRGDFLPKYDAYRIRVMRFLNSGKWCMPVCTDKRCETDTNREVTHWMPLPSAPKEFAEAENKALTLDELRQMHGQPVWVVPNKGVPKWYLVDVANDACETCNNDVVDFELYGPKNVSYGWLAYRTKPEEDEE